jgi:hypothetical protein
MNLVSALVRIVLGALFALSAVPGLAADYPRPRKARG